MFRKFENLFHLLRDRRAPSQRRRSRREQGFTLIELVVVLICLSILFALLARSWPALTHWSRVMNAEAQVARVGQAWCGSFGGSYQPMDPGEPRPATIDLAQFSNTISATSNLAELQDLEKHLGVVLPRTDIWGNDIEYLTDVSVPMHPLMPPDQMPARLLIRSFNANGLEDPPYAATTTFSIAQRDPDIVWVNCEFVQYAVR